MVIAVTRFINPIGVLQHPFEKRVKPGLQTCHILVRPVLGVAQKADCREHLACKRSRLNKPNPSSFAYPGNGLSK